ncbi:MAG: acetolactate synthase small subunit [Candidatus Omnitrophica bacterium]|nr:acetolactate synthase small subunit [Candidatus Omnitrophota bacterium]MDD5430026.1 acetolactate synthase small subunit [Candidatus Omnitrophota bacterium]
MKHTIQALVENRFGVLARVSSLFSARGYNITSLAVGETADPTVSCMTIVVNAEDERILEQIKKQLNKLIDVITVNDFTHKEYIERELILIKLSADRNCEEMLTTAVKKGSIRVIEKNKNFCIIEACSERHKIEEILKELKKAEVIELVRTGKIAIGK